tara:strand:+ start:443 stop:1180 length:738 start_codon:yes stop_codon:yes gene_type:complete
MRIGKIIITIFTWLITSFIIIWAIKESSLIRNNQALVDHKIEIENSEKQMFLKESDVVNILQTFGDNNDSLSYKEINIALLEELLRDHPQILQAEVFSTWKGLLKINVIQKKAKARMIDNKEMAYVDEDGNLFPLSEHDSDKLTVISGFYDPEKRIQALNFIEKASKHPSFPNGISSVHKKDNGTYIVYPAWHDHSIEWGLNEFFEIKAHKAQAVYAYLLETNKLEQLSHLDLRFNGQAIYKINN